MYIIRWCCPQYIFIRANYMYVCVSKYKSIYVSQQSGIFAGTRKSCRLLLFLHAYHGFVIQNVDSANCGRTHTAGKLNIMRNSSQRIAMDRSILSTFATSNYSLYRFDSLI